jgi:SAM-dependent methyltransferase
MPPVTHEPMRRFWNDRAEENAFFFVDNRLDYRDSDVAAFWTEGEQALAEFLAVLGAALKPDDKVVEIGCGVGRLTRPISSQVADVRAVDVSERMLELAREHNPSLANVEWLLGDGTSLAGIESGWATACISHVVFQHIVDPRITLGYVREIGRVLAPGGWAAFQVSNNPEIHRPRRGVGVATDRLRALAGRAPRGQNHPAWRGSSIEIPALRAAASDGGMEVARLEGEGTQFCLVLTRRRAA